VNWALKRHFVVKGGKKHEDRHPEGCRSPSFAFVVARRQQFRRH
jgi:hypothetical protein